jgi:hypothetical protein
MGALLLQWAYEKYALRNDLAAEVQDESAPQILLGVAASLC